MSWGIEELEVTCIMRKILTLGFVSVIVFFWLSGCTGTVSNDIAKYLVEGNRIQEFATDVMPALDELPAPEKINYRYADFFGESYVLVVTYDENTYKSEKAKLEQSYTFLNRALVDPYNDGKYTIPEYKFAYGGYDFHVVETEGSCYPKYFGLVGSSDSSFSIAYVYFCDLDLDYIESMDRFMKNEIDYDW